MARITGPWACYFIYLKIHRRWPDKLNAVGIKIIFVVWVERNIQLCTYNFVSGRNGR